MKKTSSEKIQHSNSWHINRISSKKLTCRKDPQFVSSIKIQVEKYECSFCKAMFTYKELFKHLEKDCENFVKGKPLTNHQNQFNISRLNFNAVTTPITETRDPDFESIEFQEHTNLGLVGSSKSKGENKKIQFIKKIEVPRLALGQIHLKFNQFCVFGLSIKNRYARQFIAYRVEDFNVQVCDLTTSQDCALLTGHADLVTEIRYFKSRNELNLLFTCSYDGFVFVWDVQSFTKLRSIHFKTWALSIVLGPLADSELIFICGGYSKTSPIKAFDLESGEFMFDLSLQEAAIPVIMEKYQQGTIHLLFCGTDSENPAIFIFDYEKKQLIKSFPIKCVVTSFTLYSSARTSLLLYSSDYNGTIREIDLCKMKLSIEFNVSQNLVDLIVWDDYFMICCGERTSSLKTIIRDKHRVCKAYPNLHDKVVLNLQKFYFMGVGNCLFTLSADKTIKIFKF